MLHKIVILAVCITTDLKVGCDKNFIQCLLVEACAGFNLVALMAWWDRTGEAETNNPKHTPQSSQCLGAGHLARTLLMGGIGI